MSETKLEIPEDLKAIYEGCASTYSWVYVKYLVERIARLQAPVTDEECRAFENSYGEKLMLNYVDFGLSEFIRDRAQGKDGKPE